MAEKHVISSYRDEVNKLRWKFNQLEVHTVEQRASDEVRQWRENFDTSSSNQLERMVNEIEKRKQSEVSRLANELRISLEQFKETNMDRLAQLDAFILRTNIDDEIQLDYIKFELDTITKKIQTLHMDIRVQVVNTSKKRRASTPLARNMVELTKVFDFKKPETTTTTTNTSSSGFLRPVKNFVRRASTAGASYYNIGILNHPKHS